MGIMDWTFLVEARDEAVEEFLKIKSETLFMNPEKVLDDVQSSRLLETNELTFWRSNYWGIGPIYVMLTKPLRGGAGCVGRFFHSPFIFQVSSWLILVKRSSQV